MNKLNLFLSVALTFSSLFVGTQALVAQPYGSVDGAESSGGGNNDVTTLTNNFLEPTRRYIRSAVFDYAWAQTSTLDPKYLDHIAQNVVIRSIDAIPPINPGEKPPTMQNYWKDGIPYIDVDFDGFGQIQVDRAKWDLFSHEIIGLHRVEGKPILDQDRLLSPELAQRVLDFKNRSVPSTLIAEREKELMECYQALYTSSEFQGDYWDYTGHYLMLPRPSGGFYLVSTAEDGALYETEFNGQESKILFLMGAFADLEEIPTQGTVIQFWRAEGGTIDRIEVVGNDVRKYFFERVLPETFKYQLQKEDPTRFMLLMNSGELDTAMKAQAQEFLAMNDGMTGEAYFLGMYRETVELVIEGIDRAAMVESLRDRIVARIPSMSALAEERTRKAEGWNQHLAATGGDPGVIRNNLRLIQSAQEKFQRATQVCGSSVDFQIQAAFHTPTSRPPASAVLTPAVLEEEAVLLPMPTVSPRAMEIVPPSIRPAIVATSSVARVSRSGRPQFLYEIPKNDPVHQDPDWANEVKARAVTWEIVEELNLPSHPDNYNPNLNQFRVKVPGDDRSFLLDINCSMYQGISINRTSEDRLADARRLLQGLEIREIRFEGYHSFRSEAACLEFQAYLEAHGSEVTESAPIYLTIDNANYRRVVKIEHFTPTQSQ